MRQSELCNDWLSGMMLSGERVLFDDEGELYLDLAPDMRCFFVISEDDQSFTAGAFLFDETYLNNVDFLRAALEMNIPLQRLKKACLSTDKDGGAIIYTRTRLIADFNKDSFKDSIADHLHDVKKIHGDLKIMLAAKAAVETSSEAQGQGKEENWLRI